MESIGFVINEGGMCFGISAMAEQALLAGELDQFLARIKIITDHLEYQENGQRKNFKDYFNQLGTNKTLSEAQRKQQWQEKIDIEAFFNDLALYMLPGENPYAEVLNSPKNSFPGELQRLRAAEPIVRPVKFDKKDKENGKQVFTRTSRDYFREYTPLMLKKELEAIFNYAKDKKQPLALGISGEEHQITVLCDPRATPPIFMLFDPNYMPITLESNSTENIVSNIFNNLSKIHGSAIAELSLRTTISSTFDISSLIETDEWLMNEKNIDKLFNAAYEDNNIERCKQIIKNLEKNQADIWYVLTRSNQIFLPAFLGNISYETLKSGRSTIYDIPDYKFSPEISDDKALGTVKYNGLALQNCSKAKKEDSELVWQAYLQNSDALAYADSKALNRLALDEKKFSEMVNSTSIATFKEFIKQLDPSILVDYLKKTPNFFKTLTDEKRSLIHGLIETLMITVSSSTTTPQAINSSVWEIKDELFWRTFFKGEGNERYWKAFEKNSILTKTEKLNLLDDINNPQLTALASTDLQTELANLMDMNTITPDLFYSAYQKGDMLTCNKIISRLKKYEISIYAGLQTLEETSLLWVYLVKKNINYEDFKNKSEQEREQLIKEFQADYKENSTIPEDGVLMTVGFNGLALKHAPESLKNTSMAIELAINGNPHAIEFVDTSVVLNLLKKNELPWDCLLKLSPKRQSEMLQGLLDEQLMFKKLKNSCPKEVKEFFCQQMSKEQVLKEINRGHEVWPFLSKAQQEEISQAVNKMPQAIKSKIIKTIPFLESPSATPQATSQKPLDPKQIIKEYEEVLYLVQQISRLASLKIEPTDKAHTVLSELLNKHAQYLENKITAQQFKDHYSAVKENLYSLKDSWVTSGQIGCLLKKAGLMDGLNKLKAQSKALSTRGNLAFSSELQELCTTFEEQRVKLMDHEVNLWDFCNLLVKEMEHAKVNVKNDPAIIEILASLNRSLTWLNPSLNNTQQYKIKPPPENDFNPDEVRPGS